MEDRGEAFLPACWEFLTFNFVFVLVSFLLLRVVFVCLKKYYVAQFIKGFSSLVLLGPMLFDGNLQYFCFLLFSQISMGFSLTPKDKAFVGISYIIYFFIIQIAVVSSFMSYYLNHRLTEYILDNWKTKVTGLIAFSITNACRMLLFGALHSLLRYHPAQLQYLMGA